MSGPGDSLLLYALHTMLIIQINSYQFGVAIFPRMYENIRNYSVYSVVSDVASHAVASAYSAPPQTGAYRGRLCWRRYKLYRSTNRVAISASLPQAFLRRMK